MSKLARRVQRLEDKHRRDMAALRRETVGAMLATMLTQHRATMAEVQRVLAEYTETAYRKSDADRVADL